ncbi:hypothetical protein [Plantactinospora sp. BB1]|uniref:hypothetical protein n=1 Tax=Plantactinospora sp. BB1 TaxID=2071627 RepID=UPI00131EE531|nr:hypothetical protein [Plantactinospora sp. BB1]
MSVPPLAPTMRTGWEALQRLPSDADPDQVLSAAGEDLAALGEQLQESAETALRFQPVQVSFVDDPACLEVQVEGPNGGQTVRLGLRVILAARNKDLGPLELLASALVAPKPLADTWRPKRIGQALPPSGDQLLARREMYRLTPAAEEVDSNLNTGHHVLVTGDHGSGRSALAAHFATKYLNDNRGVIWLNLSDPADGPESVAAALLQLERLRDYLLVIDGLHANIPAAWSVFDYVKRIRQTFGVVVQVLATGWTSVGRVVERGEQILDLHQVRLDATATIRQMLADATFLDNDARLKITKLAGQDVHIAKSALDFYEAYRRCPTELDLQQEYTGGTEDPMEQRALYHLACLGVLGLAMASREADQRFDGRPERLHGRNLVHRTDDAYTIGPRRRAQLVVEHALKHWTSECYAEPEDIIWRHLQAGGARAIRATLSRLDQIVSPDSLRDESLYLLSTWDLLEQLASYLERKIDEDPTWGDSLGAAVFAATALTRLRPDDTERWRKIAEPIRNRWQYENPEQRYPIPVGGTTDDFTDFTVHIAEAMRREDEILAQAGNPPEQPADQIDQMVAYQNWVLGLLLGLESSAPADFRDTTRIKQLVAMAERAQEPAGSYYPGRVPWVTARVLIGMSQAGQRADNPLVSKSCRWLIGLLGNDGRKVQWWRSGTGTWNSDEATTAMCLTALTMTGYPSRQQLTEAAGWLERRCERCAHKNRELDLANMLETLTLCSDLSLQPYLKPLLERMDLELRKPPPPPSESRPEERLRMPFITYQLANVVWQTVRTECRALLSDVLSTQRGSTVSPVEVPLNGAGVDVFETPRLVEARPCGLRPGQLGIWHNASNQLISAINDQINKRAKVPVQTVSVQRSLAQLLAQRDTWQELSGELAESAPRRVLEGLDRLGRQVLDVAWPKLPFPLVYCDESRNGGPGPDEERPA